MSLVNKDAFSKSYLSYGLIKDSCLIRRVLQGVIPCYEMMRLVKKVLPAICYYLLKRLKIRLNLIKISTLFYALVAQRLSGDSKLRDGEFDSHPSAIHKGTNSNYV